MAGLRGPLFSLGATGRLTRAFTLARRLTGPRWLLRGRPADPKTEPQLSWRTMWQLAASLWHQLSAAEQAVWESAGTARGMTGYAWYMSQALRPNPGIYLPLAGGKMSGAIDMDEHEVEGLEDPVQDTDAARKGYVDAEITAAKLGQGAGARRSTNQSIPNTDTTAILFSHEQFDNDGMWGGDVNPSRLTVQTPGLYIITGQIAWAANVNGARYELILLNGAIIAQNFIHADTYQGGAWRRTITTIWDAAAADYFALGVYQSSGGNLDVVIQGTYSPALQAVRIGE